MKHLKPDFKYSTAQLQVMMPLKSILDLFWCPSGVKISRNSLRFVLSSPHFLNSIPFKYLDTLATSHKSSLPRSYSMSFMFLGITRVVIEFGGCGRKRHGSSDAFNADERIFQRSKTERSKNRVVLLFWTWNHKSFLVVSAPSSAGENGLCEKLRNRLVITSIVMVDPMFIIKQSFKADLNCSGSAVKGVVPIRPYDSWMILHGLEVDQTMSPVESLKALSFTRRIVPYAGYIFGRS
ncbi:hypothetical protein AT4G16915 [Arabidopsis thaliana]|uniref:Uncharacterized protein n=1 Tax=Arabidopsis thaliana TaxID=3702 RepID=F4JNB3_ARATH|nr:uncharacterized protein AT4G16915 [Arabidopsis thaliana]AEE83822.1 hypothetical protein AT4G16915 [Arabidopsis thaliana]|eukprot:NP_001154244.1 hypothetical protein AT4G16915 [Arabidopsis thaliana]